MKTILALIDFDGKSMEIMETAYRLADDYNAELIIYHHLGKDQQIRINEGSFDFQGSTIVGDAKSKLEANYKISPEYRIGTGNFKNAVLEIVDDYEVDLIVMSSNGVSNVKESILGSHAIKVIDSAPCSVLILKDISLATPLKEIVFASSFNEMDKEVLKYFLQNFKLSDDAVVHLLMVDTYTFFNQPAILVQEAFKDFQDICKPYQAIPHFFHGISIEDGIVKFMEKNRPDLLVMSNKYSRLLRIAFSTSKMNSTIHENRFPFLNIDYEK